MLLKSRSRDVTVENLAICFPEQSEQQRAELAKHSLQHLSMTALELGPVWSLPVKQLFKSIARVTGEKAVQAAVKDGKGFIILAPHIGSWELLGLYLGENYPFTSLYQPPDNPAMHEVTIKARSRSNANVAPTNTKGVKILLQALKRGEGIGILPDQVPPAEGGGFAPFFAVPALTTTLATNLARRTGARVFMGSALRIENSGKFEIIFDVVPETIGAEDMSIALTTLNQCVENCVLRAPEQYQWEYKRFKKQPGGERKYYRNKN